MPSPIKLGISIGDINGVGPEVILKAFSRKELFDSVTPIVYGSKSVFDFYLKSIPSCEAEIRQITSVEEAIPGVLNIIELEMNYQLDIAPGTSKATAGRFSFDSLQKCTEAALKNQVDAILTAPINKANIQSSDFQFPGHTEYLAKACGLQESLMFLIHNSFRIAMVTGHVPLSEVAESIRPEKIDLRINQCSQSLKNDFGIESPKIALLSLNPHAGDDGLLGTEELEVIIPSIKKACKEGKHVEGPFPSDGFFGAKKERNYDAVIGMYHDQALTPFKAISFDDGVNFTAALPIIRTSPDHGTAYDIAGKNMASAESFERAAILAAQIYRSRSAKGATA